MLYSEVNMNEWKAWLVEKMGQRAKAEQEERTRMVAEQKKAPKRRITPEELEKVRRLAKCSLRSGYAGGDQRFVGDLARANEETEITERQAWFLEVLWYRYRRQLGHNEPKPKGMT